MADDASWSSAMTSCTPMLEALAKATSEHGRMSARTWWVLCMGSRLGACKESYGQWRAEASKRLPKQLKPEHTEQALGLPGFEPLAQCVLGSGEAVRVDAGAMLDRIESRAGAAHAWTRAVEEVEPLRQKLQLSFLKADGAVETRLAATAGEMDIDELRVCQVWMYGLASRLAACQPLAQRFAKRAGMKDPNSPLQGFDESRWDPRDASWQEMEMCVHHQASGVGTETDQFWRRPLS